MLLHASDIHNPSGSWSQTGLDYNRDSKYVEVYSTKSMSLLLRVTKYEGDHLLLGAHVNTC